MIRPRFAGFITLLLLLVGLAGCQTKETDFYYQSDGEAIEFSLPVETLIKGQPVSITFTPGDSAGSVEILDLHHLLFRFTPSSAIGTQKIDYLLTDALDDQVSGTLFFKVGQVHLNQGSNPVPLNALTYKGTHNSYHVWPHLIFHNTHAYSHPPLYQQLAFDHVQVLELDVHLDPLTKTFQVYHILGIDPLSRCATLTKCLEELKLYSRHYPQHDPVFVWIEVKDSTGGAPIKNLDALDKALASEMGDLVMTPDEFRQTYSSPRERLQQVGWPSVEQMRGRFFFILLNSAKYLDSYTHGFSDLHGRVMFPRAEEEYFESPWAAFTKGTLGSDAHQKALSSGLMTATNACSADQNDIDCKESIRRALEAGVHMIKLDNSGIDIENL